MRTASRIIPCVLALCTAFVPQARGDVKLPAVFGSHMVLQRDRPLPIWGTASPGEEVVVTLGDKSAKATADDKGAWKVSLPPMSADGKEYKLTVAGKNKIELDD